MPSYTVKRDINQNGRTYRKGSKIELSERQARHLLIAGFIEPQKEQPKPSTAAKQAAKENGKQDKGGK